MSDSLTLLRNFVKNKKEFQQEDDKIIFDDVYFNKNVKTTYLIYGTGKDGRPKDYYSLECIVYLVKNRDLQHSLYVKNAGTRNISVVLRPDRKELLSYLDGEIDTTPSIDKYAHIEIALQRPQQFIKNNSQLNMSLQKQTNLSKDDTDINNNSQNLIDQNGQPGKKEMIEKLNKKFDTQSSRSICENIIPLSEKLSVEKIISIKQKKKAQQRLKVSSDVEMEEEDAVLNSTKFNQSKKENEFSSFKTSVDTDESDAIMREILRYEKVCRKRSNVLQSSGKQFDKDIGAFLSTVEAKEQDTLKTNNTNTSQTTAVNVIINQNVTSQKARPLGYNRFDQERYSAKDETGGFSIDTKLTYQPNGGSISLSSNTTSQSQNKLDNLSSNQSTSLATNTSSSVAAAASQSNNNKFNSAQLSSDNNNSIATKSKYQSSTSSSSSKRIHATPIIVVPAAKTSLIQMINVTDILQELKYVSIEDKKKILQNQNVYKEAELIMHKKKDGSIRQFKIIDDVKKLKPTDWERIIAVFVHGAHWQFKDWQIGDGDPVKIFSKVKAFHLKLSGTPLESNIPKWSVRIIELDTNKRHLDKSRLVQFWDDLNI